MRLAIVSTFPPFRGGIAQFNGGAIAIGHPLGMTGARILLACAKELARRNGRYGLVTLCIGVGQGYAAVIKNCQSS